MKHHMMYLDALERAKVELSLISNCRRKLKKKKQKQIALQPLRVGQTSVV